TYESSLDAIAKCALLSIDSTMRSNISVGPPINMVLYAADSFEIRHRVQLPSSDPYLAKIRKYWESTLRAATQNMPDLEWNRVSIDAEPDFSIE
ncbi:MAG: peptidase, partial [Symploca sp. SIO2G7]|nr:peptidase [Symploca sp. SIO2G7]